MNQLERSLLLEAGEDALVAASATNAGTILTSPPLTGIHEVVANRKESSNSLLRSEMIRNDAEYAEARARLNEEHGRLADHEKQLQAIGLNDDQIKRVIDPLRSFHLQLAEEVEGYGRFRRGESPELEDLVGLGHLFISLRIARGLSQKELTHRLGTHESQVSRDERNEYFGVSVERANRILRALKARLHTRVEVQTDEPVAVHA